MNTRLDYADVSSDIKYTRYHCICCCGISEQSTIKIDDPDLLKISSEHYNICGYNTYSNTRLIKMDNIRSIQTIVGCKIDPSPYECLSVFARKYYCAPTKISLNVDGMEYSFSVHNKDAYVMHALFVEPIKHEMR